MSSQKCGAKFKPNPMLSSGGSRTSMDSAGTSSERSNGSAKITATQWWAIAILTFVNLINYMDRYTIAGKTNTALKLA